MYNNSEKEIIVSYMTRFTQAVSIILRRYKGSFGPEWNGIDSEDWSMVLYFCNDGVHGKIIPKWLGHWVKPTNLISLDIVPITKYKSAVKTNEACQFSLFVKKTEKDGGLGVQLQLTGASTTKDIEIKLIHEIGKESTKMTLPQVFILPVGFDQNIFKNGLHVDYKKYGIRMLPYQWSFSFFSSKPGLDALSKFDKDPFIEAHGLVNHILDVAGIGDNSTV